MAGDERCAWCGFVFAYDDETTILDASRMIADHYNEQHARPDLIAPRIVRDLASGTISYEAAVWISRPDRGGEES